MDFEDYTHLMQDIRKLSKFGWVYVYSINNEGTSRKMINSEYGEFEFNTWLKLQIFTDKWKLVYKIEG